VYGGVLVGVETGLFVADRVADAEGLVLAFALALALASAL
jgi:hypothetical protein